MITPAQCQKVIDDILFDSFGVYHYVFLETPDIKIDRYRFSYSAEFGNEVDYRVYRFEAELVDDRLIVTVINLYVGLNFDISFKDGKPNNLRTATRLAPDFSTSVNEYKPDPNWDVISSLCYTICQHISARNMI